MNPDDYCRRRAYTRGSSLYYSSCWLAPAQRRALAALHAYCSELADTVAAPGEAAVAAAKLDWWQSEIERLFAGHAQHPVTRALAPHLQAYGLTQARLLQLIAGRRIDLAQNRFLDFPALAHYCQLTAGAGGELAAGIYGVSDPQTYDHARQLGQGLQLILILREVGADARRGRIYLPLAELRQHRVTVADILARRYVAGFTALMQLQAARAHAGVGAALRALPAADYRAQRPGLIQGSIHASLLAELARDRYQVLHQRIVLTPLHQLLLAWRTWVFGPPKTLVDGAPLASND